jgi:hypothetical protein
MKFCYKILAILAIATTCGFISCSSSASYSYQNVAVNITFGEVGYSGNYTVNPPGDGGIVGSVMPQCSTVTNMGCTQGGTEYCSPQSLCQTNGSVLLASGGGAGTCIQLFANVTNAPLSTVTWTIVPYVSGGASVGGFNSNGGLPTTTGPDAFYCEPSNPPIYSGAQMATAIANGIVDANGNIVQGTTEVIASVPSDPNNPSAVATAHIFFSYNSGPGTALAIGASPNPNEAITSNSVTSNIVVPRGTSQVFTGYVVGVWGYGNPCNITPAPTTSIPGAGILWGLGSSQANAEVYVAGTNPTLGTIVSTGPNTALYTAPATPPSPNTVVVVARSLACYVSTTSPGYYTGGSNAFEGAATTITVQ